VSPLAIIVPGSRICHIVGRRAGQLGAESKVGRYVGSMEKWPVNKPNYGDILLWMAVSVPFFRAMDSGFQSDGSGSISFRSPSWVSSVAKAMVVVSPLPFLMFAGHYRSTPIWDTLCLVGITMVVGPIAFPQLSVEFRERSLLEKLGHWLLSRIDVAVKKSLLVGLLSLLFYKVSLPAIAKFIAIPHYFTPRNVNPTGPFTVAVLVVALGSLILRAMIILSTSKLLAFTVLPLSGMLVGYVMDLGGSLHPANVPVSMGLFLVVTTDLVRFLVSEWSLN